MRFVTQLLNAINKHRDVAVGEPDKRAERIVLSLN
jgi:hypothetical protein